MKKTGAAVRATAARSRAGRAFPSIDSSCTPSADPASLQRIARAGSDMVDSVLGSLRRKNADRVRRLDRRVYRRRDPLTVYSCRSTLRLLVTEKTPGTVFAW